MSYTTVAYVKRIGGLNEPQDYNVLRLTDPAELDLAISDAMLLASAWVRRNMGGSAYDAIAGGENEVLFKHGEACAVMMFLLMNPKTRQVTGTGYALDAEGSERYEELIDQEWPKQVELAIGSFFQVNTADKPFARPVMVLGQSTSRRDDPALLPFWMNLEGILQEVRGQFATTVFTEDK